MILNASLTAFVQIENGLFSRVNEAPLGFRAFVAILKHVALLRSKQVAPIDRYERMTSKCSQCGTRVTLTLKQRTFACPHCGLTLDRDHHNAAINILHIRASLCHDLGIVSPASAGRPV